MMKAMVLLLALVVLMSGCAKPIYSVDQSGNTASVTYIREDVNHYIDQDTGALVPVEKKDGYPGRLISTEYRRAFPTIIYLYHSTSCGGTPVIMGRLEPENSGRASKTLMVKAGVPLVNSYRTKYQTCERDCYKQFYTSSVFVPEKSGEYEVVLEPIDGTKVYKLENGQKVEQETGPALPAFCQH